MKRNLKLFLGLSLLALILVLTGCGGGGGGSVSTVTPTPTVTPTSSPDSSPTPAVTPTSSPDSNPTPIEKGPSSDYLGLEVGAKLVFSVIDTPSNETWSVKIEVISVDQYGAFKTKWTVPDEIEGEFIKKGVDGVYTEIGSWEELDTGEEVSNYYPEAAYKKVFQNPLYIGFTSERWGTVLRQETITVPAGTFKAWVFKYDNLNDNETNYSWFVENLGPIKYITETNGTTENLTVVLESYSFLASKSNI